MIYFLEFQYTHLNADTFGTGFSKNSSFVFRYPADFWWIGQEQTAITRTHFTRFFFFQRSQRISISGREMENPNHVHIKNKFLRLMLSSDSATQHVPADWLECSRKPGSFVRSAVDYKTYLVEEGSLPSKSELMNKFRKMEFECYCQRCEHIKYDVTHPFWAQLLPRITVWCHFHLPNLDNRQWKRQAHTSDLMTATPLKIQPKFRVRTL